MEKTDDEIIREYIHGDEGAFQKILERYLSNIQRFVFKMVHDSEVANDITQETFIKVWKNIANYEQSGTFRSWIFTIAHNNTIDYFRKKKILVFSDFENEDGKNILTDTIPDTESIPEILIEKAENKKLLDTALETLSPLEKEVLLLHYMEDMTFDTIGKTTRESLNTVKSRHRRALIKLKKYLEEK